MGILVGYEGSHIFKVYVPSRKGPIENRIVQSSNVRFDEGGLITKPLPDEDTDISIPAGNRGESSGNQDQQDSDLIHQRVPNMPGNIEHQSQSAFEKATMLELQQINEGTDPEQPDVNSDIEQSDQPDEDDTESMPEATQKGVETELEPKPKGRPKGSKNRVYTPNPEFNRETC